MDCAETMSRMGADAGPHEIVQIERHLESCARCREERARRAEAEAWVAGLEIPEDPERLIRSLQKVAAELRRENLALEEREEGFPLRGLTAALDSFVLAFRRLLPEGPCAECGEDAGSRPALCLTCRGRERREARATWAPPTVMRGTAVGFGALLSAGLLAHTVRVDPAVALKPVPEKSVTSVNMPEPSLASVIAHNPPVYDPVVPMPKDDAAREPFNDAYVVAHGVDGEPDQKKVYALLQESAELGYSEAMYQLALCHRSGYGAVKDEVRAYKWFRVAAEAGHPWARFNLGVALSKGLGVEADHEEARVWLERALLDGVLEAGPHLEALHEDKLGGPRDESLLVQLRKLPAPDFHSRSRRHAMPIWKQKLDEKLKGK